MAERFDGPLTDAEVEHYIDFFSLDGQTWLSAGDVRRAWEASDFGADLAKFEDLCASYAYQYQREAACESQEATAFEEAAYGPPD